MRASRHFLIMYGSQTPLNWPRLSHTYATFIERLYLDDGSPAGERSLTISWLPDDGEINPLGGPETGRNYGYEETIAWLDDAGSFIRWESPETEIEAELFRSAEDRCREFDAGTLQYIMVDNTSTRPHNSSNCIHAVMDLPAALAKIGMRTTGLLRGIDASRYAYRYLSPFFLAAPRMLMAGEHVDDFAALEKMAEEPLQPL